MADWLSRHHHMENKDEETHGMNVRLDGIQMLMNVPEYMSVQQIQQSTAQWLKGYIIAGWPEIKDEVQWDIRPYCSFKDDMTVIDRIIMKGKHVIISEILKTQALDQLHINHMGIEKNKLLACKSIYLANITDDNENFIKKCTTCLTFQQTQPKGKMIYHEILVRPWDVIGKDMFTHINKHCLCILDYHSKDRGSISR